MLHAMICYERAAHYLRTTVTPEALDIPKRSFASRRAWLSCLANESFWDGYVNEGKAASRVASLRDAARDDREARLLHGISVEELEHSRLGLDLTRWCQRELRGVA